MHKKILFIFITILLISFVVVPALAADTENYVDNNTSDVDSFPDDGTESSFAAEQSAPDSSFDTLTEAATSSPSNSTVFNGGFEVGAWDSLFDATAKTWLRGTATAPGLGVTPHAGTNMSYAGPTNDGSIYTDPVDCSDAVAIYVSIWYYDVGVDDADDWLLSAYDGAAYDLLVELGTAAAEGAWRYYEVKLTDSQYFDNGFRLRIIATSPDTSEYAYIDDVIIIKETGAYNYELNLERQWTTADYDETTEELCIYTGVSGGAGGESLMVDVWDGDSWVTVIADLADSQWNNVSISSYLTSATFTIRLMCDIEVGDSSVNTWQIDSMLLHTWTVAETYLNKFGTVTLAFSSSKLNSLSFLRWGTATSIFDVGSGIGSVRSLLKFSAGVLNFDSSLAKSFSFMRMGTVTIAFSSSGILNTAFITFLNLIGQATLALIANHGKAISFGRVGSATISLSANGIFKTLMEYIYTFFGTVAISFIADGLKLMDISRVGSSTLTFSSEGVYSELILNILNLFGQGVLSFSNSLVKAFTFSESGTATIHLLGQSAISILSTLLPFFGGAVLYFLSNSLGTGFPIIDADSITGEDAAAIGIIFGFIAIAIAVSFPLIMRRRRDDD